MKITVQFNGVTLTGPIGAIAKMIEGQAPAKTKAAAPKAKAAKKGKRPYTKRAAYWQTVGK